MRRAGISRAAEVESGREPQSPAPVTISGEVDGLASRVRRSYEAHLKGRPLEGSLLATATYFATLIAVRVFTTLVRGSTEGGYVDIAGVHVHHLVFGVVALLIAGLFALDDVWRLPRAALFGIGAALVLDEFALLVFLKDVYWLPQGVLSVAALAIGLAAMLVNGWRGRRFFVELGAVVTRSRPASDAPPTDDPSER